MNGRRHNNVASRHLQMLLVFFVLFVFAGLVGRGIEHAPTKYLERATVVFTTQAPSSIIGPTSPVSGSLITTAAVMVQSMMSSQSQALVRHQGGEAEFSLALVNFDNQDFPNYSYPFATLTAQSTDPHSVHRTFTAALQVLSGLLTERQLHISTESRILIQVVGDTGPIAQKGSLKRSIGTLALLAIIGACMLTRFLARNGPTAKRRLTTWQQKQNLGKAKPLPARHRSSRA